MQFSRSIGGTLGVSVMGAALSTRLVSNLAASGLDLERVSRLLNPLPGDEGLLTDAIRIAVADAINIVFVIAFVAAFLGLISTLFTPRKELTERIPEGERSTVSAD
jgi:hypothetical protein